MNTKSIGAAAQELMCIDHASLSALEDILDRIKKDNGLGAQEDWFNEVCPPNIKGTVFQHELKTSETHAKIAQASEVKDTLALAHLALEQLLNCVAPQLAAANRRWEVLCMEAGLSSLPDEILSTILEEVVYNSSDVIHTVRAAARLSHTCRRFRRLVITIPSLWNRTRSDMPEEMVSTCLGRITSASAEVELLPYLSPEHRASEYIQLTTNCSAHWRRFTHYHSRADTAVLKELVKASPNLDVSYLSELCIQQDITGGDQNHATFHYYSKWLMPKLSSLEVRNFVPIPLKTTTSLKSVNIEVPVNRELEGGRLSLLALQEFLASCEFLEDLALTFTFIAEDFLHSSLVGHINLNRVTNLKFILKDCPPKSGGPLIHLFRCPIVSTMKIKLRLAYYGMEPSAIPYGRTDNTLRDIFPDESMFPNLFDLNLDIAVLGYSTPIFIVVPFPNFGKLRRLTLTTLHSRLAPIPEGRFLDSLTSLVFRNCYKLESDWITALLGQVITQGSLHPSQLIVVDCVYMKYPENSPADDARQLPEQVNITAEEMIQLIKNQW